MRKQLAVRVTRLESFRRYRDENSDFDLAARMREELVGSIISPPPPNRKMQMGTAFHTILANPQQYRFSGYGETIYKADEIRYSGNIVESVIRQIDYNGLFEVPMFKVYPIDDTDFIITGTCDHILGSVITDFKTRWFEGKEWGVWDDNKLRETYEASFQWRLYLDMFDCDTFKYLIVAMRDSHPVELVKIKTDIVCHAYQQMRRDIDDLLYDFLHFVNVHELESHLQITERELDIIAQCEAFA